MQLVIGNKNYSSWSMRPWLLLKHFNIAFEEHRIALFQPQSHTEMAKVMQQRKVPVLLDQGLEIWDSLAICEYLNDTYLNGAGWPSDDSAKALARSITAEMHSSFFALREQLPMNCRREPKSIPMTEELQKDIARVQHLWQQARDGYAENGPWLFGDFSIADCFYAPVALRLHGYAIELSTVASDYVKTTLAHPAVQDWISAGICETEVMPQYER